MCPTPQGRVHTRVASMALPAVLGLIMWLITQNPDWFVLIGVLLLLGVTLDSAIYAWAVKWQPPWMTGVLALVELGLLLILATVLELDIGIVEGIVFYIAAWLLFVFTKIVLLPILSLTYVESAGEFRTTDWSIPASREPLPLVAATEGGEGAPGQLLREASGVHAVPLQKRPGLSGVIEMPADLAAAPRAEAPIEDRDTRILPTLGSARGDVPAPEPASASQVHQALNPTTSPPANAFDSGATRSRSGSAATRVEATVVSYAIVVATAVGVTLYVLAERV